MHSPVVSACRAAELLPWRRAISWPGTDGRMIPPKPGTAPSREPVNPVTIRRRLPCVDAGDGSFADGRASGDHAWSDLVGGFGRSRRLRARIPTSGSHRSTRRSEREPNQHGRRVRDHGHPRACSGTRQHAASATCLGPAARLGCKRITGGVHQQVGFAVPGWTVARIADAAGRQRPTVASQARHMMLTKRHACHA